MGVSHGSTDFKSSNLQQEQQTIPKTAVVFVSAVASAAPINNKGKELPTQHLLYLFL